MATQFVEDVAKPQWGGKHADVLSGHAEKLWLAAASDRSLQLIGSLTEGQWPKLSSALEQAGVSSETDRERLVAAFVAEKVYVPSPQAIDDVVLPTELEQLTELLAENTHEEWAIQRMRDGWTHGPCRDDEKKHHPCLVPYAELSETEREYDRRTSMNTLKLLLKMGYRVERAVAENALAAPPSSVQGPMRYGRETILEKTGGGEEVELPHSSDPAPPVS